MLCNLLSRFCFPTVIDEGLLLEFGCCYHVFWLSSTTSLFLLCDFTSGCRRSITDDSVMVSWNRWRYSTKSNLPAVFWFWCGCVLVLVSNRSRARCSVLVLLDAVTCGDVLLSILFKEHFCDGWFSSLSAFHTNLFHSYWMMSFHGLWLVICHICYGWGFPRIRYCDF